ncbi:MAG: hypothetical protein RLZZ26_10 [Candidatus Parcubacteria bacterium]|jgi:beta-lactamase class A
MKLSNNQNFSLVALVAFFGGVVCTCIFFFLFQYLEPSVKPRPLRESDIPTSHSTYSFIDPLIGIRGVDNTTQYDGLKSKIAAFIDQQAKNDLISASVQFRDINEPGGFTLNPTERYTPASLNKVPVMMAYYKIAERDPSILSQSLKYTGATDSNSVEGIKAVVQLTPGASYTVEQLIEHMIRYSDNNATDLLVQNFTDTGNTSAHTSVYSDLGIDPSVLNAYTDNMTVQNYSIFLRALYNATYLSRDDSERALKLLSETDFSQGIESGVPNNVTVAEKFGEVRMTDTAGTLLGKELNNCGIVYYPSHPYLLCIMTKGRGDDNAGLETVIAGISRMVYEGVQSTYQ